MQDQFIGMLTTSAVFALAGFSLTINERFAAWGLSRGRARIWVKLFG